MHIKCILNAETAPRARTKRPHWEGLTASKTLLRAVAVIVPQFRELSRLINYLNNRGVFVEKCLSSKNKLLMQIQNI